LARNYIAPFPDDTLASNSNDLDPHQLDSVLSSLSLVVALTGPGNQPQTIHTEKTGTGGLIVPRNIATASTSEDNEFIVDPDPIVPQLRSTPVVTNGQTMFPFPAPRGMSIHFYGSHGSTGTFTRCFANVRLLPPKQN
jgi:hypothetical protein